MDEKTVLVMIGQILCKSQSHGHEWVKIYAGSENKDAKNVFSRMQDAFELCQRIEQVKNCTEAFLQEKSFLQMSL